METILTKGRRKIILVLFLFISFFAISELVAQEQDDSTEYVLCPGWGYKCISITKQTWLGAVTVPVYLKGKDKPMIEFIDKQE
ncbi:hypothetical protein [Roseivirga echinicomitans]|uniref:Uncharacterized protein n=1 Tax=Roseivirga echinicomitans TaxID=296218 RepID=A0A150X1Q0_9BACT|nr:hypothetical protein [Roseivirga echinicomitans]KYG72492.1 hypothetical protein AWN68_12090 [Roseivirga echinicomitans]